MRSGRVPVFAVFVLNGVIAGSWAPRIPALAERIDASPGELGFVLLGASLGLVTAAPFGGRWNARFGAPVMIAVSAFAAAGSLPLLALASSPVQLALVLALLGGSFGVFDVSVNVAATTVIRRVQRPLMPVMHAGESFGALGGSLLAAAAAGLGVGLLTYFSVVAVASMAAILAVIRLVPREERVTETAPHERRDRGMLRRPVLWLLGGIAFISAIIEGANGDWSALYGVSERGLSEAAGAILFSVFSVAMAVVRLVGEPIQRRFGAVRILTVGSVLTGTGLLSTAIVPVAWLTYVGYALAGAGVAFAFPAVLDLAGSFSRRSDGTGGEQEIGFVTTIGYSGFLLGPPLIGVVGQLTDLSVAIGFLGVLAMIITPTVLAAAATRRREVRRSAQQAGRAARRTRGPRPARRLIRQRTR